MNKNNNNNIASIIYEQFKFLIDKYDFHVLNKGEKVWGYEIVYINDTTGIKIIYENREAYLMVTTYKLVDKELIENPIIIKPDTVLNGYGFDDILTIRQPSVLMKPIYEYDNESIFQQTDMGIYNYIGAFSNNLQTYGDDILRGNFDVFRKVDLIVKDRLFSNRKL